jgi:hypothetical protein
LPGCTIHWESSGHTPGAWPPDVAGKLGSELRLDVQVEKVGHLASRIVHVDGVPTEARGVVGQSELESVTATIRDVWLDSGLSEAVTTTALQPTDELQSGTGQWTADVRIVVWFGQRWHPAWLTFSLGMIPMWRTHELRVNVTLTSPDQAVTVHSEQVGSITELVGAFPALINLSGSWEFGHAVHESLELELQASIRRLLAQLVAQGL